MADNKKEIRIDITGDASRYTRALAEAQARQQEFMAKTVKGQQMSLGRSWSDALVENQQRNLGGQAKYLSDWSDAIVENLSKINWNANKTREALEKPIRPANVQQTFAQYTEALGAKAAAVENVADTQQAILRTGSRKEAAEKAVLARTAERETLENDPGASQFDRLAALQAEENALQHLKTTTQDHEKVTGALANQKSNLAVRTDEAAAAQRRFIQASGIKPEPAGPAPVASGTAAPSVKDVQAAQFANIKAKVDLENLQEEARLLGGVEQKVSAPPPVAQPAYGPAAATMKDVKAAQQEVKAARTERFKVLEEAVPAPPQTTFDAKSAQERQKFFASRSATWQDNQIEKDHEKALQEDQQRGTGKSAGPERAEGQARLAAADQRVQDAERNLTSTIAAHDAGNKSVESSTAKLAKTTEQATTTSSTSKVETQKSVEMNQKLMEAENRVQETERNLNTVKNALNSSTQTADATAEKSIKTVQQQTDAQRQYEQVVENQRKASQGAATAPAGGASDKIAAAAPSLQQVKEAEVAVTEAAGQLDAELANQASVVETAGQSSTKYTEATQRVQQAEQNLISAQQNSTGVKAAYKSATESAATSSQASSSATQGESAAARANAEAVNTTAGAKRTLTSVQSQVVSSSRGVTDALKQQGEVYSNVSSRAASMASTFRNTNVNAKDAESGLRNLGFHAKDVAAALVAAGYSAEEFGEKAEAGAGKGRQSFFRTRAAAQGVASVLSGGTNSLLFGITRMAAASAALAPILEAAFPVIGVVVLLDFLAQVPEMIDKIIDRLAGYNKAQKQVFEENVKDISHTIDRYDQLQRRRAEDQAGETTARTGSQAKGLVAEDKALSDYQQKVAETQKKFTEFKALVDTADQKVAITIGQGAAPGTAGFSMEREIQVPKVATPEFKANIEANRIKFNDFMKEVEKQTGQTQVQLDPINWEKAQSSTRDQLSKMSETIKGELTKMMESQIDVGERRSKITPQAIRAEQEEELKRFTINEELKTELMGRADEARIASAKRVLDATENVPGGTGSIQYLQAQLNAVRVTKQVRDAQFSEERTTMQDQLAEVRSNYDEEAVLARQKFAVALTAHGAESAAARATSAEIVRAKREEVETEVALQRLLLIDAIRIYGLQSEQARQAYGEVVKAAAKANAEIRKLNHDLHIEILREREDEISLGVKKSEDELINARKNSDVQLKIAEEIASRQARRGAQFGGVVGSAVEEGAMARKRELLDEGLAADRTFVESEHSIAVQGAAKKYAALDSTDPDYPSKFKQIRDESAEAEKKYQDGLNDITRRGALERQKIDDLEIDYRERREQGYLHAWMSMWDTMLFRARSFSEAMTDLWQGIAKSAINAILKIVGQFVVSHILMRAIDAITHTAFIQHLAHFLAQKLHLEAAAKAAEKKGGLKDQVQETQKLATAQQRLATATAATSIAAHSATAALAAEKVPMPILTTIIKPLVEAEGNLKNALVGVAGAAGASAGAITANIPANVALAQSDAATAAAVVFLQAIQKIPFPANLAAAPAAAAKTYAEGQVYAAAAAAEGGWDLPSGGPFPAILHAREMVLPASLANNVRNMSNEGGDFSTIGKGIVPSGAMANMLGRQVTHPDTLAHPAMPSALSESFQKINRGGEDYARQVAAGSSHNSTSVSSPTFHFHQGDVHALDGDRVGEVMSKSPATFVKMVQAGLKRGAFGNVKTIQRRLR